MCVCSIISPLAAVHSSQLLPVRTCEQYGGYTCPACVTAQVVEDLTSTYASGLSQMKYEYYSSQASLQRSKALFKEVNEAQKDAIRRVLSTCHVDASFIELITPILDITESLLPKQAETRQLDAELAAQVGSRGVVHSHPRSLGRVQHTTKVCANRCS